MRGHEFSARIRVFATQVLRLSRTVTDDPGARHVVRQLVRSATGCGANYEEARGAESRADFIHKLAIANKEARESLYWLQLAMDSAL